MNFYNHISLEHLEILEESYQGKTATLKKAEKCCDAITRKIRTMSMDTMMSVDINDMKEVRELASLLKKEFGFNSCELTFNNAPIPNAFTIPARGIFTVAGGMPCFPVQNNGKYYDSKHGYTAYVFVYEGLVKSLDLSGGELLAIILHEIGHNFETTFFAQIWKIAMGVMSACVVGLPFAMSQDIIAILAASIEKVKTDLLQKQFPSLNYVINIAHTVGMNINSVLSMIPLLPASSILMNIAKNIYQNPFDTIYHGMLSGTSGEIFADSFAATYGYGPEMASASAKMTNITSDSDAAAKAISRTPVLGLIKDFNTMLAFALIRLVDPHPDDQVRILNNVKKLEKDLNDPSIPSKLKKDIKRDLEEVKKVYSKTLEVENYEERNQYATFAFRVINDKLGGHLDIKNTIMRALPFAYA